MTNDNSSDSNNNGNEPFDRSIKYKKDNYKIPCDRTEFERLLDSLSSFPSSSPSSSSSSSSSSLSATSATEPVLIVYAHNDDDCMSCNVKRDDILAMINDIKNIEARKPSSPLNDKRIVVLDLGGGGDDQDGNGSSSSSSYSCTAIVRDVLEKRKDGGEEGEMRGGGRGGEYNTTTTTNSEESLPLPSSTLYVVKGGRVKKIDLVTTSATNPRTYVKVLYDLRDAILH